jgi:hypothetical protein
MKYVVLVLPFILTACGNAVSGSACVNTQVDATANIDKLNLIAYINGCRAVLQAACKGDQDCIDKGNKFCDDEKARLSAN